MTSISVIPMVSDMAPIASAQVNSVESRKEPKRMGESHQWDSNPRPDVYETPALPAELWWQRAALYQPPMRLNRCGGSTDLAERRERR